MKCPYGKLTSVQSFGVISANEPRKDICNTKVLTIEKCKVVAGIDADIISKYRAQNETLQRKRTYLYSFTEESLFGTDASGNKVTVPTECTNEDARVFVSFYCQQDSEQLQEKHQMASKIACLGVLMVLVYLTCLHYFKRHSELDQVRWDMLTITPGDYTMQMEITEKMYKYYMEHYHSRHPDEPVAVKLKEHIKSNLERQLNEKLREMKNKPKL